jgi:hypothetical protein
MPTQRIGAACFYTAVAVSQCFIAVVAGSGPGFRSLVLSAAGKSVQAVRSYNPGWQGTIGQGRIRRSIIGRPGESLLPLRLGDRGWSYALQG